MAKKKKNGEGPAGAPAWMATFGDMMNLLLCFFVLLFSMSTVDAQKFELLVASLNSSFSILPSGSSSIGEGMLISAGVSQLTMFETDYNILLSPSAFGSEESEENDFKEEYQEEALKESEQMAEEIEQMAKESKIIDDIQIDFTSQYVLLTLNGALLFESGKAEIREQSLPLVDKIGAILENYSNNIIEIEGHTDNVPISSARFGNNDELSFFRALEVTNYIRNNNNLEPARIKFSGRGEYVPIADNGTAEGRARNRRVEIKIYNTFSNY